MVESFLSRGDVGDRKVLRFEGVNQGVRDGGFVFDNQDRRHGAGGYLENSRVKKFHSSVSSSHSQ